MTPDVVRLAYGEISGPIVVGKVRSGVASGFGATDNLVWLSMDTLRKQLNHHRDLRLDFYEDLDWLLFHGEVIADRRPRCINVVSRPEDPGYLFKATIKIVRSNSRMMLLSVHKIGMSDYKRIIRRSKK